MPTNSVPFRETHYFSNLICDYLDEKPEWQPFYNRFPKIENFKAQIEEKRKTCSPQTRKSLVKSLNEQYKNVEASKLTFQNINALQNETTFTVTTGHQLNLFTGPLYFFYKIVSTINLCKELKAAYPEFNFVPIYWMATEDHDFEEINFFNFNNEKIQWIKDASGAVGELHLSDIENVFHVFEEKLGLGKHANELKQLFKTAYLKHQTLTEATRYLVNELFTEYGLVILDGNDNGLKSLFKPFIKDELLNKTAYRHVSETNERIKEVNADYTIQVNPREINLFYLNQGVRERIVEDKGQYSVLETQLKWDAETLLKEVDSHPERFSPNVILRPLYQEVILPNLCYIGGGGELAYWFQLQSNFEAQGVTFPMLLLRNSVLVTSQKQRSKLEKLDLKITDLFMNQDELVSKVAKHISSIEIDFSSQKEHLKNQFKGLYKLSEQTDKSFVGAVAAQERKQIKGLEHLEKRLLKAQKRKHSELLNRVSQLQNELFPNGSLQERYANFSEFYLVYGDQFIQQLVVNLQPLKGEFTILNLD
ncbi:bacillithiol biosynthesis cysteine-adding enzyme BshC [Hanstruepera flava]|uniref:bacillithiol biosynthesis cysteine-adding enzyme BshC n=1 Tax=Hanstruepera flava TaxID=2930218 RepID=UPI0020282C71|nr:bacillithiol biosynthesis cysteine-adding enzyme BshC [Hanstruepera flava]